MKTVSNNLEWNDDEVVREGLLSIMHSRLLIITVLLQPVLYSSIFWAVSESVVMALVGFMLGCLVLVLWMCFESGLLRAQRFSEHHFFKRICDFRHAFWVLLMLIFPVFLLPGTLFFQYILPS